MYDLQTAVEVGDKTFNIRNKGDFRMVLDCFEAINDSTLTEAERLISCCIIFYEDFNSIADLLENMDILEQLQNEMIRFFNGGEDSVSGNAKQHRLIDWTKDSNLICSAINNVAKQEIRSLKYLHWWTFLGYYNAIGECPLTTIVSIRYKIAEGKKLEKYEVKFQQDNPEYFNIDMRSAEQKEADDYIHRLWGE